MLTSFSQVYGFGPEDSAKITSAVVIFGIQLLALLIVGIVGFAFSVQLIQSSYGYFVGVIDAGVMCLLLSSFFLAISAFSRYFDEPAMRVRHLIPYIGLPLFLGVFAAILFDSVRSNREAHELNSIYTCSYYSTNDHRYEIVGNQKYTVEAMRCIPDNEKTNTSSNSCWCYAGGSGYSLTCETFHPYKGPCKDLIDNLPPLANACYHTSIAMMLLLFLPLLLVLFLQWWIECYCRRDTSPQAIKVSNSFTNFSIFHTTTDVKREPLLQKDLERKDNEEEEDIKLNI